MHPTSLTRPLVHRAHIARACFPHRMRSLASFGLGSLLLFACGDRALDDLEPTDASTDDESLEDTASTDAESTDTDTDADASSSDDSGEPEPEPACDCVDFDLVCGDDSHLATLDCELPTPCGVLNDEGVDPAPVECILQLLIEQQPARFQYHFEQPGTTWDGWFYILGSGVGLDNECTIYRGGGASDDTIPQANDYDLADPATFEDCLGGSTNEMRSCLLAGLQKSHSVPQCQE